jgi:hypothetical protein
MSGTSIDEAVGIDAPVVDPQETVHQQAGGFGFDFDFFKAETGEGRIEDYLDHPLNFNSSKPMARVIRGLTGMFDNLNLAIIDIVIGGLEYVKDKSNRSTKAESEATNY